MEPEFSLIVGYVQNNSGVVVNLLLYSSHALVFKTFLCHYVAITVINRNGFIALSDPFQNEANLFATSMEHNDASVVSYDVFPVNFTLPFTEKASWWIEEYFDFGITRFGGLG